MTWLFTAALFFSVLTASAQKIDIQGHRGARGVYPENTIPAFLYAIEQGVTTLELDVVISADGMVVVSHEPWMSHDICLDSDGNEISRDSEKWNIYQMPYEEVQQFDCGSLGNKRFPEQQKMKVSKPLLSDMISQAERFMKSNTGFEFDYNIELKSSEKGDGIFHPGPAEFSRLVHDLIDQYLPWRRVVIQSFDFRILKYWNEAYPDVRLAALIENTRSPEANITELGFTPAIYSPYYRLINVENIKYLHEQEVKVIPWTVNEVNDMESLIEMGVDGIITDYPNRAAEAGLTLNFEDK
jgi:glycerophosphoryl diester phosphodiesterase